MSLIYEPEQDPCTFCVFAFAIKNQSSAGRCTVHGSYKNELFHVPNHDLFLIEVIQPSAFRSLLQAELK